MYITSITQAEILYGIELLPRGKRRAGLSSAFERLFAEDFEGQVLPFDEQAARIYAGISAAREKAGRRISEFDAMIAAIARAHGAAVATRDTAGFDDCGVHVIDPWAG